MNGPGRSLRLGGKTGALSWQKWYSRKEHCVNKSKDVGGIWNPAKQAWEMRYDHAVALRLKNQIVEAARCYISEPSVTTSSNLHVVTDKNFVVIKSSNLSL